MYRTDITGMATPLVAVGVVKKGLHRSNYIQKELSSLHKLITLPTPLMSCDSGMPWMFPDVVVTGVLMSVWAST